MRAKQSDNFVNKRDTKDSDLDELKEGEGWRDWLSKGLDEDVVTERWRRNRG